MIFFNQRKWWSTLVEDLLSVGLPRLVVVMLDVKI